MRRVIGTYFNFAISSFISHLPFTNCRTPLLDLCYKLFQHKLNGTRHKNKRIFPTININQNISHIFQHFPMISTIFSHVFPRPINCTQSSLSSAAVFPRTKSTCFRLYEAHSNGKDRPIIFPSKISNVDIGASDETLAQDTGGL